MTATGPIFASGSKPTINLNVHVDATDKWVEELRSSISRVQEGDKSLDALDALRKAALKCGALIGNGRPDVDELHDLAARLLVKDAEKDEGRKMSDRETAAKIALEAADLFHDESDVAYATVSTNGQLETLQVRSARFKAWLIVEFHCEKDKWPSSDAISVAMNAAESEAKIRGPLRQVHMRTAYVNDVMYIDLCDEHRRVVRIDAEGRTVGKAPPDVRFIRSPDARPLPVPEAGGGFDLLKPFVNYKSKQDFQMIVAWLVGAMAPDGPYKVLVLVGEQGSAKSSTARALRQLIDPVGTPTRRAPTEERDLAIAARWNRVLIFDNLSRLTFDMSDALCRLATGGGFGTRELYTNDAEQLFYASRPVLLNGIDEFATRGDLRSRSIVVELPRLDESVIKDEATMRREFEEVHPLILGALCDAISTAIRRWSDTRLPYAPRMADFARWVVASQAVPDFLDLYSQNAGDAIDTEIDASPFALAVLHFAGEKGAWKGRPADLLDELNTRIPLADRGKVWPADPTRLGGALRRYAPALRRRGIQVESGASNSKRFISLADGANSAAE